MSSPETAKCILVGLLITTAFFVIGVINDNSSNNSTNDSGGGSSSKNQDDIGQPINASEFYKNAKIYNKKKKNKNSNENEADRWSVSSSSSSSPSPPSIIASSSSSSSTSKSESDSSSSGDYLLSALTTKRKVSDQVLKELSLFASSSKEKPISLAKAVGKELENQKNNNKKKKEEETATTSARKNPPVLDATRMLKFDLVKQVGESPIEAIDPFIGLGGKRLKLLKLRARDQTPEWWQKKKRLVWFDLGARVWPKGSTQWFARHYPNSSKFEAECYDVLKLRHSYPPNPPFAKFNFYAKAAWTRKGTVTIGGVKMGHVKHDSEVLDKTKVTVWQTESIDFAQELKKNFSDPDSFIVVKMDIEGGEWPLIQHLEQTGALDLIDEMMLECHPPSPDFATEPEKKFSLRRGQMHPDCIRLLNRMRLSGVFAHGWF